MMKPSKISQHKMTRRRAHTRQSSGTKFKNRMAAQLLTLAINLLLLQDSRAHEFQIHSKITLLNTRKLWDLPTRRQQQLLDFRGGSDYNGDDGRDPYRRFDDDDDDRYDRDRNYRDDDQYYERDYDDRGSDKPFTPSIPGNLPNIIKNGDRRVGMAFLGSGAVFTMFGVSLFFNKSLMRLGNLLFVAGVPLTIGPGRTAGYFFQPKKARATGCLALGMFLVFIGSPVFGIILEIFGLLNLFGNMFPLIFAVLKQMPIFKSLFGDGGTKRRTYDDRYEDSYPDDSYGTSDRYGNDDERYDRYYGNRNYNDNSGRGSDENY